MNAQYSRVEGRFQRNVACHCVLSPSPFPSRSKAPPCMMVRCMSLNCGACVSAPSVDQGLGPFFVFHQSSVKQRLKQSRNEIGIFRAAADTISVFFSSHHQNLILFSQQGSVDDGNSTGRWFFFLFQCTIIPPAFSDQI